MHLYSRYALLSILVASLAFLLACSSEDGQKTPQAAGGNNTKAPTATTSPASPPPASTSPKTDNKAQAPVLAKGTLKLAEGAKAEGKLVFVSLRSVEGRGPPIAALRLPPGPFPMSFVLTEANVIAMGGQKRPVPAEFMLKATLDTDGNPMVKSPQDLVSERQVARGTEGLELVLAPAGD